MAHNFNLTVPLNGTATQLTISGNSAHGILTQTGASTYSTIAGVTLTAGKSSTGGAWYSTVASTVSFSNDVFFANVSPTTAAASGAAVYAAGSPTVTIANCSFVGNLASVTGGSYTASGGALYQSGGTLTITGSTFSGNQAVSGSYLAYGGAMYLTGLSSFSISTTGFIPSGAYTNNIASSTTNHAEGGAIYLGGTITGTISRSLFEGNQESGVAGGVSGGGALNCGGGSNDTVTFTGDTFTMNTGYNGGAISASMCYVTFYNDTITGNTATNAGGGFYVCSGCGVGQEAYNTIISGNAAASYPDDAFGIQNRIFATYGNYLDYGSTCATYCTPLLSALGSYGGPTVGAGSYTTTLQSMIPLPGSPLLRAGVVADDNSATVDARGYPRTLTVGGTQYIDSGATEANYSAAFVQQPTNAVAGSSITPAPTVQVYESGVLFNPGANGTGDSMTIAASSPTLSGAGSSFAISSAGLATFSGLSITPVQNGETLTASLPLDGTSTNYYTVTSNSFNMVSPIAFVSAPATPIATNGNAGTVTVEEYSTPSTAYVSGDTMTLTVTGPSSYSQSYIATSSTGTFSFNLSAVPLATLGTYTYTASDSTYTTYTAVATETVASPQVITFTQPTTPAFVNAKATLVATGGASGNPVTFSIVNGPAMVSGANDATITYNGAGTVVIAANQAGSGSYPAAAQVTQTVTVVKQSVFVVNSGGSVSSVYNNGSAQSSATSGGGTGAAVDAAGYVWSINTNGSSVSLFTDAGAFSTSYSSGGISGAKALAIDGNSNVVIANGTGRTETLSNAGAVVSTTQGSTSAGGSGVAIDLSGNVWVANPTTNSVDEIIGGAVPVTPLANAVSAGTPATKP